MARRIIDESDSEYSETDESFRSPGRRRVVKRRSFSRHRLSPDSNAYLSPGIAAAVHRSASTGGRRRRDPAIVINNDVHARQMSRERRGRLFGEVDDVEDIEIIHSHRPRASSNLSSRTASPLHRDWDLVMDQRVLENNDRRQDIELMEHKQEIKRLERLLAKSRERHDHRDVRLVEEEVWEDELAEKLRRLDRLERSKRSEQDHRLYDYREKVRRLEEKERKAEEEVEAKRLAREEQLQELAEKEKIREEKERLKKELRDEEARKLLEEEERKKEMKKIKKEAIAEFKLAEETKKLKEIEEKEKKDKEFRERLLELGYRDEQIEVIINKKKEKETALVPEKTAYIKVHRKYLEPKTLIAYDLPWDWDETDRNYIIIKTWISDDFQEELFAHTRRLREGKLITDVSSSLTELKVNDRRKDKMYLVRKKSPNRRSWIFT